MVEPCHDDAAVMLDPTAMCQPLAVLRICQRVAYNSLSRNTTLALVDTLKWSIQYKVFQVP